MEWNRHTDDIRQRNGVLLHRCILLEVLLCQLHVLVLNVCDDFRDARRLHAELNIGLSKVGDKMCELTVARISTEMRCLFAENLVSRVSTTPASNTADFGTTVVIVRFEYFLYC